MSLVVAPPTGLEPVTSWLTVMRSTDWAMEEYRAKHPFGCMLCVGISLSSRAVTSQVFSAPLSLTSVFGMGTGGPSHQSAPTIQDTPWKPNTTRNLSKGRRLHLQSLLTTNCRSSPRLISISQLHTLRCFHLWPINVIVYDEPYSIKDERSYLRGSFTLRCLQRLSRPDVATQLCPWQDNWCTSGQSIPVLSY